MFTKKTKCIWAVLVLLIFLFSLGCGSSAPEEKQQESEQSQQAEQPAPETEKLRVAAVIPGSINDAGWNAVAYDALKAIERDFGAEISYAESVPTSDFEERFRAYATAGYNVIIGHGFEFGDTAMKVAPDFPDVKFIITSTDIHQEPNLASVQTNNYEGGWVVGAIAGIVTETNKVAYIGGMDIPSITLGGNGFVKGAKYINPDIEAFETYTGDFEDAAKAKELMKSFIEKGADVGVGNADHASLGPIEACAEAGLKAVGIIANQNDIAPDSVVGSVEYSYAVAIKVIIQDILDGKFEPKFYNGGFKDGALVFYPNDKVMTAEQKARVEEIINGVMDGSIDIGKPD